MFPKVWPIICHDWRHLWRFLTSLAQVLPGYLSRAVRTVAPHHSSSLFIIQLLPHGLSHQVSWLPYPQSLRGWVVHAEWPRACCTVWRLGGQVLSFRMRSCVEFSISLHTRRPQCWFILSRCMPCVCYFDHPCLLARWFAHNSRGSSLSEYSALFVVLPLSLIFIVQDPTGLLVVECMKRSQSRVSTHILLGCVYLWRFLVMQPMITTMVQNLFGDLSMILSGKIAVSSGYVSALL